MKESSHSGDGLFFDAILRPPFIASIIAQVTRKDTVFSPMCSALQADTAESLCAGDVFTACVQCVSVRSISFFRITWQTVSSFLPSLVHRPRRWRIQVTVVSSRLKNSARSYLWWPQIDNQVHKAALSCHARQSTQRTPPEVPMPRCTRIPEPWRMLHVDFARPVESWSFLIVDNGHTRYL